MILSTILILTAIYLLYWYLSSPYTTWKRRNIPGPKPKFLEGNFRSIYTRSYHVVEDFMKIYEKYHGKEPIVGVYVLRHPQLMVLAPEMVKDILVKQQRKFSENCYANNMSRDDKLFGTNLFFLHYQQWKEKRHELSPGFAVSKIKAQVDNMRDIALEFCQYIKRAIKYEKSCIFDMKPLATRYTAEISSSIVFGVKANSFSEVDPAILSVATNLIPFAERIISYFRRISFLPFLSTFTKIRISGVDVESFFEKLSVDVLKLRQRDGNARNDYVNHVLELMKKKGMSEKEMTGDFVNLFLDAFETTSVFLTYVLYEIARHKEVQDRLRKEINGLEGSYDYETVESLQYLDQVVFEAIRLHPILVNLVKVCTDRYHYKSEDGTQSFTIEKGDVVNIPLYCIHRDPLVYKNPENFDPERFNTEHGGVKKFRQMCSLIPFGEGPRQCLGMRYSLAEVKIVVIELLKQFEIKLNSKTQNPLTLLPDSIVYLSMPTPVWIEFCPL